MKKIVHKSAAPIYAAAVGWGPEGPLPPPYKPGHFMMAGAAAGGGFLLPPPYCQEAVGGEEGKAPTHPKARPEIRISDGELAIREMKRLNDSIKDETISRQIDRLEEVSGKIFDCVKADPKKLPQIRKFMNYYLPTTLKLLNAYDRMSSQGVEGQNISGTMERVESMMSNIVTAFERQLDSLFGDQALDISTDITVLENMMAREGLSDDPIHQTREETPAAEEKEGGEDGDGIRLEL